MDVTYVGSELEFLINELKSVCTFFGNDSENADFSDIIDITAEGAISISAF